MAEQHGAVTSGMFQWVIGGLVGLAIAVVGAGFTWLHSDLADMRTDTREIRATVIAISGRVQDTREEMLKTVAAIEEQAAITNTKLDTLIDETRKRR